MCYRYGRKEKRRSAYADRAASGSFIIPHSSVIIRQSSCIIHQSSSIIHHSSFIIHHPSFISHHSSSVIHQSLFVSHHSSVIIHHSSIIIHQPSFVSHHSHPSLIIHQPSTVIHHPSTIIHHPSSIIQQSSSISHQTSVITHQSRSDPGRLCASLKPFPHWVCPPPVRLPYAPCHGAGTSALLWTPAPCSASIHICADDAGALESVRTPPWPGPQCPRQACPDPPIAQCKRRAPVGAPQLARALKGEVAGAGGIGPGEWHTDIYRKKNRTPA